MQLKQKSNEGHTAYLAYSTDTVYRDEIRQKNREDSNYYTTIPYRNREKDTADWSYYHRVFPKYVGKVRGVW